MAFGFPESFKSIQQISFELKTFCKSWLKYDRYRFPMRVSETIKIFALKRTAKTVRFYIEKRLNLMTELSSPANIFAAATR